MYSTFNVTTLPLYRSAGRHPIRSTCSCWLCTSKLAVAKSGEPACTWLCSCSTGVPSMYCWTVPGLLQYLGTETSAVMIQAQQLPGNVLKQTEQMQRLQQGMLPLLASPTA